MYWLSRGIYKNESVETGTKNTPVVDVSAENPFDDSVESDDVPLWDETPQFSVEAYPGDCVNVNLCDTVRESLLSLGALIDSGWVSLIKEWHIPW